MIHKKLNVEDEIEEAFPDRICEYKWDPYNHHLRKNLTNCDSDYGTYLEPPRCDRCYSCKIRVHSVKISDSGIWECQLGHYHDNHFSKQSENFEIMIHDQ